jgi:hypothetical protein
MLRRMLLTLRMDPLLKDQAEWLRSHSCRTGTNSFLLEARTPMRRLPNCHTGQMYSQMAPWLIERKNLLHTNTDRLAARFQSTRPSTALMLHTDLKAPQPAATAIARIQKRYTNTDRSGMASDNRRRSSILSAANCRLEN